MAPTDAPQNLPRDLNVDALRCIAITALISYHASIFVPARPGLQKAFALVTTVGWVGTDLLLAIAGFYCLRSARRAAAAKHSLASVLRDKALRILPAYYVFLVLYLYVILPTFSPGMLTPPSSAFASQVSLWTLTSNLYFAGGYRIGWSLEPMFALALGAQLVVLGLLVFPRVANERWNALLAGVLIAACAVRIGWREGWPWRIYASPLTRVDAFMWGAYLAHRLELPDGARWVRRHAPKVLVVSSGALAVLFLLFGKLYAEAPATKLVGYPVVGLWAGACLGYAVTRTEAPRFSGLVARLAPLVLCVYLVKLPVIFLIRYGVWPTLTGALGDWGVPTDIAFYAVTMATSGLFGLLLYRVVQVPVAARWARALPASS